MNATTQLTIADAPADPGVVSAEPQQLLAIDPGRYVALVFEPFSEKLARYKTEADAVTFDVTTAAGMKTAIEWRAKFRDEIRIASENARKERKAPILEIGRLLDSRAKELAKEVAPYEARFDDAIKAEEAKKEAARKAREEAERQRIAEIQRRLVKLESLGSGELYTSEMAPERLQDILRQLEEPSVYDYAEFAEQATTLRQRAIVAIRQAHVESLERIERETAERQAREAEEARKAAERQAEADRLAEVRRKLAEERAEHDRQAAVRRQEEERRQAEERARLEAEHREQERVTQIRQWIIALNGPTHLTATDSPLLIELEIRKLEDSRIDGRYGEFFSDAAAARAHGIARLTELCNAAHRHQAEQRRIAEERAELERQQAEQAERQAEIERREREQRETEERQRREAAETEERRIAAEQAERERQEAEAARQREVEER